MSIAKPSYLSQSNWWVIALQGCGGLLILRSKTLAVSTPLSNKTFLMAITT